MWYDINKKCCWGRLLILKSKALTFRRLHISHVNFSNLGFLANQSLKLTINTCFHVYKYYFVAIIHMVKSRRVALSKMRTSKRCQYDNEFCQIGFWDLNIIWVAGNNFLITCYESGDRFFFLNQDFWKYDFWTHDLIWLCVASVSSLDVYFNYFEC